MRILSIIWLLLFIPQPAESAEVVDDLGRSVRIDKPAERIVSLAPHATELLFSAGAGDKVVGAVEYSDFPEAAKAVPRVGDAARLDRERILGLRPDLIIGWESGNNRRDLEWLESRGTALYLSEPSRLEQIAENIRELGLLSGTSEEAGKASDRFLERLGFLRSMHGSARRIRIFFQLWHRPLMTVSGRHFVNDALKLCGGLNIFDDLPGPAPTVTLEAVIGLDPEVILIAIPPDGPFNQSALWRRWSHLQAVRDSRILEIRADLIHRPTARILEGAEQICGALAN